MKCMRYDGIHEEIKQSCLEGQTGQHTCQTRLDYHAQSFRVGTITQAVTTTTSQRVCEKTTNFGPVPYVDTNARKIAGDQDRG